MTATQTVNRNVKILCGRLYSPSLKDVAWLEDAQLIFTIFIHLSNFFFRVAASFQANLWKIIKNLILGTNVTSGILSTKHVYT